MHGTRRVGRVEMNGDPVLVFWWLSLVELGDGDIAMLRYEVYL